MTTAYIGTAGWPIPAPLRIEFPAEGSLLQRYAARFRAVEINSSFHRPHQAKTYTRWASSVPPDFRFAFKLPRTITHERRLIDAAELLAAFLDQTAGLGGQRGPLLVQLPPSLAFDAAVAATFFTTLRSMHDGPVVVEARHLSWFDDAATQLLSSSMAVRVMADPAIGSPLSSPVAPLVYYRLHGSPRMYYSNYDAAYLLALATELTAHRLAGREVWCIFDNTGAGAATANALALMGML